MKTKLTILKLTLLLSLALPMSSFAKTYALYLCGGSTATLQPTIPGINPADVVIWNDFTTGTGTVLKTGSGTDMNFTIPANLPAGEHIYRVNAVSASPNSCIGDYKEFVFYVLPAITVNLTLQATPNYCENAAAPLSVITANPNTLDPSITDIEFTYTWTGSNASGPITPISSIGSASGNTFSLTTTTAGTYTFGTTAVYALKSGATGVLRTDCTATSATSGAVTVTPKPTQPTIITIL